MNTKNFFILLGALVCTLGCSDPLEPVFSGKVISESARFEAGFHDGDSFVQVFEKDGGGLAYVTAELKAEAGSSAYTFSITPAPANPLAALYPASLLDDGRLSEGGKNAIPIVWPSNQSHSGNSGGVFPMYSLDKSSPMRFICAGGLLRIQAKGSGKVRSVSLVSSAQIAGKGEFQIPAAKTVFSKGDRRIDLDCGAGVDLTEAGVYFDIILPCGNVPDAVLLFSIEYSGRQITVSRTLEEAVNITSGAVVSTSVDIVPDGALVSATPVKNFSKADITNFITGFIVERLSEGAGDELPVSPQVITPLMTTLFNTVVPNKQHFKTTVEYLTKDPSGNYVVASGLVCWPADVAADKKYDRIVSVQHGTCDIDCAPSLLEFSPELAPVFKTDSKNVVVLADYLGYGSSRTSNLEHPYLHAALTGSACTDMLRAAETYLAADAGFRYDDKSAVKKPISLCGYSQGGQGTIATLYALQEKGYTARIDDVKAGGSPLNIIHIIDSFLKMEKYDFMGYLVYTIRGLMYGDNLSVDLHNVYAPEVFSSGMDAKFNSTMITSWHKKLGTDVHKVLHPDFFKEERNADIDILYESARNNSIIGFPVPANPSVITLYHEPKDEQVPYSCSVEASAKWGCKLVDLTIADDVHFLGAIEFFLRYLGDDVYESAYAIIEPFLGML